MYIEDSHEMYDDLASTIKRLREVKDKVDFLLYRLELLPDWLKEEMESWTIGFYATTFKEYISRSYQIRDDVEVVKDGLVKALNSYRKAVSDDDEENLYL